jgi:hypothetical protein
MAALSSDNEKNCRLRKHAGIQRSTICTPVSTLALSQAAIATSGSSSRAVHENSFCQSAAPVSTHARLAAHSCRNAQSEREAVVNWVFSFDEQCVTRRTLDSLFANRAKKRTKQIAPGSA